MASERAMRVAEAIGKECFAGGDETGNAQLADLIDRAMGLPELEARVCKHGWRGSGAETITDRCPACGNCTLFIGAGGFLTCSWLPCPQPGVGRSIEMLKVERDALAARVDELRAELIQRQSSLGQEIRRLEISYDKVNKMHDALAKRVAELERTHLHLDNHNNIVRDLQEERDALAKRVELLEKNLARQRNDPDYCGQG